MELRNILSIATVLGFLVLFFLSKNKARTYVLYVLYLFPFMDLSVVPASMGGFEVFEVLTYLSFPMLFMNFRFTANRINGYLFLFTTLIFLLFFGAIFSGFPDAALFSLLKLFPVFIYGKLLVDECLKDGAFVTRLLKTLRTVSIVAMIFLTAQLVFGLKFTFYSDLTEINSNNTYNDSTRYTSFFPEPQACAQFFAMMSFLFLIPFKGTGRKKAASYALYLYSLYCLFMTGGRASLVGLCAGIIVVFLFANARVKLFGVACMLIGGLLVAKYSDSLTIFNRNETVGESSDFRIARWKEAYDIFEQNPVLGIGIDNYRNYVTRYLPDQYWESEAGIVYYDNPENGYLKILTEYGGPGFVLILSFILIPLVLSIGRFCQGKTGMSTILLCASVTSWLVSFVTVYSLTDLRILILLATFVCLLIAHSKMPVAWPGLGKYQQSIG